MRFAQETESHLEAAGVPDRPDVDDNLKFLLTKNINGLILVTDRGYESSRNLEACILRSQKFITAANISRRRCLDKIRELGEFSLSPLGMEWLAAKNAFARQYELSMTVKGPGGARISADDRLRLNLYFNPIERGADLVDLQSEINSQRKELETWKTENKILPVRKQRGHGYYTLQCNSEGHIVSYELSEKKAKFAQETCGFFANMTLGIDFTAE